MSRARARRAALAAQQAQARASGARPRLLLIGPLPGQGDAIGGAKVSFARMCAALERSQRFELECLDTSRRIAGRGRAARALVNAWALARLIVRLLPAARRADAVVLCASSRGLLGTAPLVAWICRRSRRPLALRAFGGDLDLALAQLPRWRRAWARRALAEAPLLLLQTRQLCRAFAFARGLRFLPTTRGERLGARARRGPCTRLLFVGQLRPEKGLSKLLHAADRLPEHARLTLVGPLLAGRALQQLLAHPRIELVGPLAPERIPALLRAHDALLFPSRHRGEGYPGAIVEALQHGLPVVAARWRAIPELVGHEREGLLFEPGDQAGFDAAVQRLLGDAELYAQLSRAALRRGAQLLAPPWDAQLCAWLDELARGTAAAPEGARETELPERTLAPRPRARAPRAASGQETA